MADGGGIGTTRAVPRLYLYFDGPRPARSAIDTVASVGAEDVSISDGDEDASFLRLSVGDAAFAVTGLEPGPGVTPAGEFAHLYGMDESARVKVGEGVCVTPVTDARPLQRKNLRRLMGIARTIAAVGQCRAAGWTPSDSLMGADYFARAIGTWLDGGAFPALGLTSLHLAADGTMVSCGLQLIAGQEVVVVPSPEMSKADQAKLAIRAIDHIVREGPLDAGVELEVTDFGTIFTVKGRENEYIYLKK